MILTENTALKLLELFDTFTFDKGIIEATEVDEICDILYYDERTKEERYNASITEKLEFQHKLNSFAHELYLLEKVRRAQMKG